MYYKVRESTYGWMIKCPATGYIEIPKNGKWLWNGDYYSPTFSPSINETTGKPGQSWEEFKLDPHPDRNHVFIRDGKIEYLTDCTHNLAGQVVEIPELTFAEMGRYYPDIECKEQ